MATQVFRIVDSISTNSLTRAAGDIQGFHALREDEEPFSYLNEAMGNTGRKIVSCDKTILEFKGETQIHYLFLVAGKND